MATIILPRTSLIQILFGHFLLQLILFPLTGRGKAGLDYPLPRYDTVEYVAKVKLSPSRQMTRVSLRGRNFRHFDPKRQVKRYSKFVTELRCRSTFSKLKFNGNLAYNFHLAKMSSVVSCTCSDVRLISRRNTTELVFRLEIPLLNCCRM
ncbi:uncharacterized protein LOC124350115 [Daphnia pulicaria]|uniref:uncharacterized protein LOC124350115 n=1 Tax=Daphnia pulicaria TaxID=35523 RepID=UPI001EECA928|nr:uncharacterized protein LOC124350115 [Daphnia pulicaria]